jgi:hypothetical protein
MDDLLAIEHLETLEEGSDIQVNSKNVSALHPAVAAVSSSTIEAEKPFIPSLAPIAPHLLDEPKDDGLPPRLITIFLRPSGNNERDRRRIKNVYLILISHPGKDRFQFQVFENGRAHLLDFPNDTTRISSDLFVRLKNIMGDEPWRVEEITYQ